MGTSAHCPKPPVGSGEPVGHGDIPTGSQRLFWEPALKVRVCLPCVESYFWPSAELGWFPVKVFRRAVR